jgi:DNA polymerase-4
MNSYFASVEQQENPALRGKPIIVVPVMADSTCAIAASYEAKAYGIRTGTMVGDAKRMCPGLLLVPAGTSRYRDYHHRIVEVLNDHFATIRVLSVDEMACRISPYEPRSEERIARDIKQGLASNVGECMKCSVGVASNIFLAKVSSDLQKPDGLSILRDDDLPGPLKRLELSDFPGIGRKMLPRMYRHGIRTVEEMYQASPKKLETVWGGVVGRRWYEMLRGSTKVDYGDNIHEVRKTVGHSHVLPPDLRNRDGVTMIMIRLLSRALKRLRRYGQVTHDVHLSVRLRNFRANRSIKWARYTVNHTATNDDITWTAIVRDLMRDIPPDGSGYSPYMAAVTFTRLSLVGDVTGSLFHDSDQFVRRQRLNVAVDKINEKYNQAVDLASAFWLKDQAPDRIAFGTGLLSHDSAT